ncbi:hypothetical protein [Enterobacter bugandensis]|uniref:hypothetical protein n=1 Tax=Enterobacter bugandensis TaxID=881260 RepID=UPI002074BE31|nr:hypothetical protein [Enterobacter bugandensis]MCM7239186.1 hypothetical protein [Enterobacter bugandensis]
MEVHRRYAIYQSSRQLVFHLTLAGWFYRAQLSSSPASMAVIYIVVQTQIFGALSSETDEAVRQAKANTL